MHQLLLITAVHVPHSNILYIIGEKEREHVKSSMWGKYAHFLILLIMVLCYSLIYVF